MSPQFPRRAGGVCARGEDVCEGWQILLLPPTDRSQTGVSAKTRPCSRPAADRQQLTSPISPDNSRTGEGKSQRLPPRPALSDLRRARPACALSLQTIPPAVARLFTELFTERGTSAGCIPSDCIRTSNRLQRSHNVMQSSFLWPLAVNLFKTPAHFPLQWSTWESPKSPECSPA